LSGIRVNIGKFVRSFLERSGAAAARTVQPDREFLLGVNLPWIAYGCDFGANAWRPGGGVSHPTHHELLTSHFRHLAESDIRLVRWFMLCDGRGGLRFEHHNVSLDPLFFSDVDAALQVAERFGIRIMFTLLDFHWVFPPKDEQGVRAGGRGEYITDRFLRRRLLHNVVRPILRQYGRHPSIHSWDVFNEPEWVILGLGAWKPASSITLSKFRAFLDGVVDLIHAETVHQATLGLARRSSLRLFEDCSLDFQQVHWYDRQGDELWTPLESRTPVILGEFPTSGSSLQVAEILRLARKAGFFGALGWSARDAVNLSSFASLVAGLDEYREEASRAPHSAPYA
jgi:hypothetical protein